MHKHVPRCVYLNDSGQCRQWSAGTRLLSAVWGSDPAVHDPERRRDLLTSNCGTGKEPGHPSFTFWHKFGQCFQKVFFGVFALAVMLYHVVTCLCCALSVSRHMFPCIPRLPRFTDRLSLKTRSRPYACVESVFAWLGIISCFLSPRIPAIITPW